MARAAHQEARIRALSRRRDTPQKTNPIQGTEEHDRVDTRKYSAIFCSQLPPSVAAPRSRLRASVISSSSQTAWPSTGQTDIKLGGLQGCIQDHGQGRAVTVGGRAQVGFDSRYCFLRNLDGWLG